MTPSHQLVSAPALILKTGQGFNSTLLLRYLVNNHTRWSLRKSYRSVEKVLKKHVYADCQSTRVVIVRFWTPFIGGES